MTTYELFDQMSRLSISPGIFERFFKMMPERSQHICADRAQGLRWREIGEKHKISHERARQIVSETIDSICWKFKFSQCPTDEGKYLHPDGTPKLTCPVAYLNTNTRVSNVLAHFDINTMQELWSKSDSELFCLRNFGLKSLHHLHETFTKEGWKMYHYHPVSGLTERKCPCKECKKQKGD
jgi:hypothetical protein